MANGEPTMDTSDINRELHTLDFWRRKFTEPSSIIECSEIRLIGRDHEPEFFYGPGRIQIEGASIRFQLYGCSKNNFEAFQKIKATKDKPYDQLEQFRLCATDYQGNKWNGGWTSVDFFTDYTHGWPLTGELRGLSTHASGSWVSDVSSVELLLVPPVYIPMSETLVSTSKIGDDTIHWNRKLGRQVVDVLGTQVIFANEPSDEALWITAKTSENLKHPFAECWLCEPLRILLGAPIYPRMMARNFGDGTASVTLLPAPNKRRPSAFGLMSKMCTTVEHDTEFWKLYADILTMVANSPPSSGQEFLVGHKLTRFYDELVQADASSRWVKLLTLASTIEALAKTLMTEEDRRSEFSDETLASMEAHIKSWKGDPVLRGRVLNSLGMVRERSVLAFLRGLARDGVIPNHCQTWQDLRNRVMHGQLVEPWSTEEGDTHLREMIELVHALTRLRIFQCG